MESSDLKVLKLFEILENNCTQSQRELSKKLNISLGLVNSIIQTKIEKGYLKTTISEKGKTGYVITRKGQAKKIKLTIGYIQNSLNRYNDIKLRICKLVEYLVDNQVKNIVLYGTNELAEIACTILYKYDLNLIAIIDNEHAGEKMEGRTIRKASFLKNNRFDALIIMYMDMPSALIDVIHQNGVPFMKIHTIRSVLENGFTTDAYRKLFDI